MVGIVGALVVGLGILLIPLPGPGWLIVFAGLGIWAIEFRWAQLLLAWGRGKFRLWTFWVSARSWPVRALIGAVGLIFLAIVLAVSLHFTFGIDLLPEH